MINNLDKTQYIIYGHSSVGEAVYWECKRRNWKVICFCDDSSFQKETSAINLDICSLSELRANGIAGVFIIAIANVDHIKKKLDENGYKNYVLASDILEGRCYENATYQIKPYRMAIKEVQACLFEQVHWKENDKLYIRNLDLEITECCSMRCRDCSNLMQYYRKPRNYSPDEIMIWVRNLLEFVEEIYEIRVLGGEPFVHKNLSVILKNILSVKQIHVVTIYTNATIMPNEECWKILNHEKICLSITDYGVKSRNLDYIQKKLDQLNIDYEIHPAEGWTQGANIEQHHRTEEQLKEIYRECCAKNLYTLFNGKIFKCPFMANVYGLNAVPHDTNDYVDLAVIKGQIRAEGAAIIKKYLKKSIHITCDFCDGRFYDAPIIEPAIQINKPRKYHEYE